MLEKEKLRSFFFEALPKKRKKKKIKKERKEPNNFQPKVLGSVGAALD
jgi:hypothetical protein